MFGTSREYLLFMAQSLYNDVCHTQRTDSENTRREHTQRNHSDNTQRTLSEKTFKENIQRKHLEKTFREHTLITLREHS